MRDDGSYPYEPGEQQADSISWLIEQAKTGSVEDTHALWRELAADSSDTDDEGRWLRSIAQVVVGQILDRAGLTQEERGLAALDALGLRESPRRFRDLERDIRSLSMFDDLTRPGRTLTELEVYRAMKQRGHFKGMTYMAGRHLVRRRMRFVGK